jgi:glycosyltransferase involved in cell wall biosynthesis
VISASIVTTCKSRLAHWKVTVPLFAATGIPVIAVDFDCPEKSGDWVEGQRLPNVQVVRHINKPFFNPSEARNSGAAAVATDWIVFLDADRIISDDFMLCLGSICSMEDVICLHGQWTKNFNGITIVKTSDHDRVGGWPVIPRQSYGMEDTLYAMLLTKECGVRVIPWPGKLDHIQHADDLRTKHYPVKDLAEGHRDNIQAFDHYFSKRLQ